MLLKIDEEFRNLIPPLADEDRIGLENNIKQHGCETPITVWDGTIIDGHNRYDICIKNGIPFEIKEISFTDRDDAKVWMIKHELEWKGRKITPFIRLELTDKMKFIISAKAKANQIKAGEFFGNASINVDKSMKIEPINTQKEISKIAQVSTGTVAKYDIIKTKVTPEIKKELEQGTKSINEVYKNIRKEERIEERKQEQQTHTMELPTGLYNVILADPPWRYSDAEPSRAVENNYPTMSDEEIINFNPPADDNCVLFLWATSGKLPSALDVMDAWGFEYKSSAVWDKMIVGMGYYFRGQHEFLLVGRRGNPGIPEPEDRFSSIIQEKRTEHSKKPDCVYGMIEKMYPNRRYIELFARQKHSDKWDAWGNQI